MHSMHPILLTIGLLVLLVGVAYMVLVAVEESHAMRGMTPSNGGLQGPGTPVFPHKPSVPRSPSNTALVLKYVVASLFILVGLIMVGFSFRHETMNLMRY